MLEKFSFTKRYPHLIILIVILLIGLFFRTYMLKERYEFGHDADLYSWIVKDIVVNHHFRLIGQLTSAPGIFIGPMFYYLIAPFFLITNMDPFGAIIPFTILGLLTIISYYFVFTRLFSKETGLIGAFLYAVLIVTVNSDRWVVPTVTTSIWAIWYFYSIISLVRGNFVILPLLGILVGLIWDVHIALIPSLVAIPVSLFLSKKRPGLKQVFLFLTSLIITSLPLMLFEIRHNFQQTTSLLQNFITPHQGASGLYKLTQVLGMITRNTNALLFFPQSVNFTENIFFVIILLLLPLFIKRKSISLKDLLALYSWIIGIILFFTFTSTPVSEYYFSNINIIFIAFISLILNYLIKKPLFLYPILVILTIIMLKNLIFFITDNPYHKGYTEKKALVESIKSDAFSKNYPCFGISYITTPGENVGFRYLFYLNNLYIIHPSLNIPVYNIVIPDELSTEVEQKFGHVGLILPKGSFSKEQLKKNCSVENTNLTDTMSGFVK